MVYEFYEDLCRFLNNYIENGIGSWSMVTCQSIRFWINRGYREIIAKVVEVRDKDKRYI